MSAVADSSRPRWFVLVSFLCGYVVGISVLLAIIELSEPWKACRDALDAQDMDPRAGSPAHDRRASTEGK